METIGKGALIATAAAALLLAGGVVARATDQAGGEVHCAGINECKGKGSCAGAENACKAQNACKGKGFVEVSSAEECARRGGKVVQKPM
ncbi:MAG TPA: hypothetical protein VNO26_13995 [Candidatus Limnocylindria bacterium]|nr:hypothetical protein [Candidatus Limnocylindria bacterium]